MTIIGYARVSTSDQSLEIQEAALKAAGCGVIRAEKRSGTTTSGRAELQTVLDFLGAGDVLMVTRIARLARSNGAPRRRLRYRPDMATASGRTSGHCDASIAGEQSLGRQRQRHEPEKLTWRCLNRLSLSSAWFAPLNRGSLNSAHIHGTDVPVEEPSTASNSDLDPRNRQVCFTPDSDQTADIAGG